MVGPRDEDFPILREGANYYLFYLGRDLFFRFDEDNEVLYDVPSLGLPVNLALRQYFPNSPLVGHAILYSFGLPEGEDPTDDEDADVERSVIKDLLPDQLEYLSRLRIVYASRSSSSPPFKWGVFFFDPVDPGDFIQPEVYSDVPVPQTVIPALDIMNPLDFQTIHFPEHTIDHTSPGGAYDQYVRLRRLAETEIEARFNFARVLEVVKLLPKKG